VGDTRAQLVVAARYYLAELDSQSELLRLILAEGSRRPDLLADAARQLLTLTYDSFAGWLQELSGDHLGKQQTRAATVVGLGALMSSRLSITMLGAQPLAVDDDTLIDTWTEMMVGLIGGRPRP
jgi:hypothetical protein